jgi:Condensation domain
VLCRTLTEIVRRHEAWRTTFHEADGQPVAVVHDAQTVDLPVVDLSHLAVGERDVEAVRFATEEARRPFDLEAGPLFRFVLIKLDDDAQRLDAVFHQIIFDGVSIYQGFLPELGVIYNDLILGHTSSLADPPVQYQDFVRWQRATYPDEALAVQLGYWRDQLGDVQPALALPTDRPRPAIQSYAAEQVTFSLPEALSRELRAFSERDEEWVGLWTEVEPRTKVDSRGLADLDPFRAAALLRGDMHVVRFGPTPDHIGTLAYGGQRALVSYLAFAPIAFEPPADGQFS